MYGGARSRRAAREWLKALLRLPSKEIGEWDRRQTEQSDAMITVSSVHNICQNGNGSRSFY